MSVFSSLRALPLALVALLSSPLAVIAQTGGPPQGDDPGRSERPHPPQAPSKEAREAHLKREAAAMAKLSLAQRKAYFQARQDMQRQLFDKRLVDLKRFGQCYSRPPPWRRSRPASSWSAPAGSRTAARRWSRCSRSASALVFPPSPRRQDGVRTVAGNPITRILKARLLEASDARRG